MQHAPLYVDERSEAVNLIAWGCVFLLDVVFTCRTPILSWLWRGAVMHVWSQAKNRYSEVPQPWQTRATLYIFYSGESNFCHAKTLILCHFSARMEYLLMTKHTENRRAPPQHLLPSSFQRFPMRSETLDLILLSANPPNYLFKGHAEDAGCRGNERGETQKSHTTQTLYNCR